MIPAISRGSSGRGLPRSTRPAFTAESALGPGTRCYIGRTYGRAAGRPEIAPAQVTVSAVSGIYAGTFCAGGTLCVLTIDVDENGHVVNSHCADEIGSC